GDFLAAEFGKLLELGGFLRRNVHPVVAAILLVHLECFFPRMLRMIFPVNADELIVPWPAWHFLERGPQIPALAVEPAFRIERLRDVDLGPRRIQAEELRYHLLGDAILQLVVV